MSGDVQPRKRKDKKKKKDDLGVEEPRGTAAALGEGDVFMHSQSEHGTGGHWCAKVIFFSLLGVLIALVGLIILENRGLTELEANSVESQYSNILEGWIEDAPDDDHHDEHTLELKHHDEDDEDHGNEIEGDDDHDADDEHDDDHDGDDDHDDEDENETEEDHDGDDDDENDNEQENDDENDDEQENDDDEEQDENDSQEDENDDDDNQASEEQNLDTAEDDEDDDEHEEAEEPANIEIETIEKEVNDDDAASVEEPDNDDDDESQELSKEASPIEEDTSVEDDDVEFLEPDELDELPIVEAITAPKGKPLAEVGETTSEKPQDSLADEEEYERQQEALRKEKEQASQSMWLKLTVGGALLVATHAVLRRATAPRETDYDEELDSSREETPLSDRRMTLIPEPVDPPIVAPKLPEISHPIEREVTKQTPVVSSPPEEEIEDEEEEEIIVSKPILPVVSQKDTVDKELYSDEEEAEEEEIEEVIEEKKDIPKQAQTTPDVTKEVTPEPEDDDDVEIIDEEQLEEELEEEEISDVDDAELLSRLEAKYGRLPEPERPGRNNKDGGNSIEDEWPGEPNDSFWSQQLDEAEQDLRQGEWTAAAEKASVAGLRSSARARYIAARALDIGAEAKKDNQLLSRAIAAYLELLKMNDRLSDEKLLEVTNRTLDRIKFRGTYLSAEPIYKLLIRRFPDDPSHRNNLTVSLLMANRADLAEDVLKETLKRWPNDRFALAHRGFVLKTLHNRLEEAVDAFTKALEGDSGPANEPRFYYHLGDALLLLGRFAEAHEVHKRGAALGHFLSPNQRSLYNVDRLKSKPWWNVDQTPYSRLARALEKSWKEILREGEAAKALYEKEKEGLKERGEWSQLDLFARGREVPNRCARAPVTCGIVRAEVAASGCRRGQVKFSAMEAGTHVRPHVGPTNCRLRMHLALSNTKDTFIRVDQETRQWQTGKVLMFDDSFEHEVWHNGTGARLVLIVDVWHPDLTHAERRHLPAI